MIWEKGSVSYYIDDPTHPYVTYTTKDLAKFPGAVWPFDGEDRAITSFSTWLSAVTGRGAPKASTPFPSEMLVDYVRIYAN